MVRRCTGKGEVSVELSVNELYSYRDYVKWNDSQRWELIDGKACAMSPAPSLVHQRIVVKLTHSLEEYLSGKACIVFSAPVDVVFEDDEDTDTIVQPDLAVVCDPTKLRKNKIVGAPDLVVEVLSPSTGGHDSITKKQVYQRAGVKEYWIVSPDEKTVFKHVLDENGVFQVEVYKIGNMTGSVLEDYVLNVEALFSSVEGLPL